MSLKRCLAVSHMLGVLNLCTTILDIFNHSNKIRCLNFSHYILEEPVEVVLQYFHQHCYMSSLMWSFIWKEFLSLGC
jgi:hypothetical protein